MCIKCLRWNNKIFKMYNIQQYISIVHKQGVGLEDLMGLFQTYDSMIVRSNNIEYIQFCNKIIRPNFIFIIFQLPIEDTNQISFSSMKIFLLQFVVYLLSNQLWHHLIFQHYHLLPHFKLASVTPTGEEFHFIQHPHPYGLSKKEAIEVYDSKDNSRNISKQLYSKNV